MLGPVLAGFVVGIFIGTTGMGGGTLMAPVLIFLFGIPASVAVGTDLFFAGFTKLGGALAHWKQKSVDANVVKYLLRGSIPGVVAGGIGFLYLDRHPAVNLELVIQKVLAAVLIVVAVGMLLRTFWWKEGRFCIESGKTLTSKKKVLLSLSGFVVGALVTFTSVGSGTLVMLVFSIFYRFCPRKMVGTDIVHGLIITLAGGIIHSYTGHVDYPLLLLLLAGSLPGVVVGSSLVHVMPRKVLKTLIAGGVLLASFKFI